MDISINRFKTLSVSWLESLSQRDRMWRFHALQWVLCSVSWLFMSPRDVILWSSSFSSLFTTPHDIFSKTTTSDAQRALHWVDVTLKGVSIFRLHGFPAMLAERQAFNQWPTPLKRLCATCIYYWVSRFMETWTGACLIVPGTNTIHPYCECVSLSNLSGLWINSTE